MKVIKHQRTKKYDIRKVVFKVKYKFWNIRITDFINERENIEIEQEITVSNHCVIKRN